MAMSEYNIRVAGNAIGELSEKIPSNIIALNELIKNSYDAGANNVHIVLNTNQQKLIVSDDGSGMDEKDIATLLQISKSTKSYGKLVNGRYIQGSKGLGFLSVFKFGDVVTWKTTKDKERSFSINFNDILLLDDVTEYTVPITETNSENLTEGTLIEIELRKDYGVEQLKQYLLNEVNRDKILNSFIDDNFKIFLDIEETTYQTKSNLSLLDYYEDKRLFHVTYNSKSNKIRFKYLNHPKYGTTPDVITEITPPSFSAHAKVRLEIDLMLYDFTNGRSRIQPNKLFIDPTNTLIEKLTPLIFVNKNLFNNYTLFDPEITRYKKSSESITQIIGYVQIISDDKDIQFNSDRTLFLENELTDAIKNTLADINLLIQKSGSDIKNNLKTKNKQKTTGGTGGGTPPPEKQGEEPTAGGVGGADNTNTTKVYDPILLLSESELFLNISSEPLVLGQYIKKAQDSYGHLIDHSQITYEMDETPIINGVLNISVPFEKEILYIYNDSRSGNITQRLKVNVIADNTPMGTKKPDRVLIPNEAKFGYKLDFQQNPVTDLVEQLNRLYKSTRTSYIEVIACSLRALFELSVYELEISNKIEYIFTKKSSDRLLDKVTFLISGICDNDALLGIICQGLGLPSFHDFKNKLKAKDYESTIKKCHLGAHKSTTSLSESNLEEIGKDAAMFLVVVSELLNNTKINWIDLGRPWKISI